MRRRRRRRKRKRKRDEKGLQGLVTSGEDSKRSLRIYLLGYCVYILYIEREEKRREEKREMLVGLEPFRGKLHAARDDDDDFRRVADRTAPLFCHKKNRTLCG